MTPVGWDNDSGGGGADPEGLWMVATVTEDNGWAVFRRWGLGIGRKGWNEDRDQRMELVAIIAGDVKPA